MKRPHTVSREYIRYPTREEYTAVSEKYITIPHFDFKIEGSPLAKALKKEIPLKEAGRLVNLTDWNICLMNRLALLRETYIIALVNFGRDFPENWPDTNSETFCYKWKFDYYSEVFFYFFISVRDTIAQIINCYYGFEVGEYYVKLNDNLTSKIEDKDKEVANICNSFLSETKETNKIRNSFTHRFPPNQPDFRTAYEAAPEGKHQLSFRGGKIKPSSEIIDIMNSSLFALRDLMCELKIKLT